MIQEDYHLKLKKYIRTQEQKRAPKSNNFKENLFTNNLVQRSYKSGWPFYNIIENLRSFQVSFSSVEWINYRNTMRIHFGRTETQSIISLFASVAEMLRFCC